MSSPDLRGKPSYRPDIEGLRGIAVLLVVAYHAGVSGFEGGFVGVDVFFALSGYLITSLIVREIQRTKRLDFPQFYARRVRRLLPAFGLVLTITVLAGMAVFSPLEQQMFTRTARGTSVYLSNVWFIRHSGDYFAPESKSNPLLHTWSLAVEEQFYLLWPGIIALAFWRARSQKTLAATLTGVSAMSFVACLWLTRTHQPWAFYSSPARAWEFGSGGLASLLPEHMLSTRVLLRRVLGWGGLGLVLATASFCSPEVAFPGAVAIFPVVGTIGVLLACASVGGALTSVLSTWGLQRLGNLSYSWYLWHWPVLLMAIASFPSIGMPGRILAALIALVLSVLTYWLVENPIRFQPRLVTRPGLSLFLAATIPAICLAVSYVGWHVAQRALALPEQQRYLAASNDRDPLAAEGCTATFGEAALRECAFGDRGSTTKVVLFGDSHASHWFPALELSALERKWRLITLIKASCPTPRVPVYNPRLRRVEDQCSTWRESALRRIAEIHPTAVVMGNTIGYVKGPGRSGGYAQLSPGQWRNGMRSTLESLSAADVPSVILADLPLPGFDVPTCLSRAAQHGWRLETCSLGAESVDPTVASAELDATRGNPLATYFDMSAFLCAKYPCAPVIGSNVVYADSNHMTASFARSLSPALGQRIESVIASSPSAVLRINGGATISHIPRSTNPAAKNRTYSNRFEDANDSFCYARPLCPEVAQSGK